MGPVERAICEDSPAIGPMKGRHVKFQISELVSGREREPTEMTAESVNHGP